MADIQPFTALRYDPAIAGHPDDLISPPYDVVSPEQKRDLYARSPFNISHIDTDAENRYTRSRDIIAGWRSRGVLKRDLEPRMYVYDQDFTVRGVPVRRRAVFARLRFEPWDAGVILPHEHTRPRDKADRFELLRTTGVNLSPIMPMYRSPAATAALAAAEVGAPVLTATLNGERHTLSPLSVASAQRFQVALADERLYIADGHHRYETALQYRDERRAAAATWTGAEPENFVLAALVDATDPGLVVFPTHRLLLTDPANGLTALDGLFRVRDVSNGLDGLMAALKDEGTRGNAFGYVGDGGRLLRLITVANETAVQALMPRDKPAGWRALDVAVLHHALLPRLGFEQTPDSLAFTENELEALHAVEHGHARAAVLLNATLVDQVIDVALAGERMPQKSTYFYPKLGSGIVMLPLE